MNVLIDSSGWIEFFAEGDKAGKFSPFILNARKDTHKTPSVVVYEVYKKIKKERGEEIANESVAHILDATEVIPLDERIALHAAEISLQTGLAMADAIIKATAELCHAEIKTADQHFKGLKHVEIL